MNCESFFIIEYLKKILPSQTISKCVPYFKNVPQNIPKTKHQLIVYKQTLSQQVLSS